MGVNYSDKLGLRVPDEGTLNWADEVNDNTEIISSILSNIQLGNGVVFGLVASDGGTLQLDYSAGDAVVDGKSFTIASGNETATAKLGTETVQRNFLYVDSTGAVQISTAAPTGNYALLSIADCDATEITAVYDCRNLISDGVNHIINGGFNIWQRATSQTATGYGSDDRWFNSNIGTTKTNSQQSFALGQTDVAGNPKYYSRTVVTSSAGASNECKKTQRIEKVSGLAGKTITFAFDAKADASKNISTELIQNFGTGGSPSSNVTGIGINTVALTTSWQRFKLQIVVPSISGKTLGTDNNDWLQVGWWFDAGSDFDARTNSLGQQSGTFEIANVKIEIGEISTPFEKSPIAAELALCERYFEVGTTSARTYASAINRYFDVAVNFSTSKRTTPTLVNVTASQTNCTQSFAQPSAGGFRHELISLATGDMFAIGQIFTADSEL